MSKTSHWQNYSRRWSGRCVIPGRRRWRSYVLAPSSEEPSVASAADWNPPWPAPLGLTWDKRCSPLSHPAHTHEEGLHLPEISQLHGLEAKLKQCCQIFMLFPFTCPTVVTLSITIWLSRCTMWHFLSKLWPSIWNVIRIRSKAGNAKWKQNDVA